ncbi:MAG: 2-oxo acid dehydrogenase subunit E2, partial [Betaproteobacteria bacterium]|nr:2-oxo acid dehydrogenase subunit E2 [Betaproteobacteria bacterium]
MANVIEVKVPDIGDFKDIPVIEVLVKPGDTVMAEDPLVTLESDKATMEVPAPASGVVKELRLKVGDKVSEGAPVLVLEAADAAAEAKPAPSPAAPAPAPAPAAAPVAAAPAPVPAPRPSAPAALAVAPAAADESGAALSHASPSVRRFARELGVDLSRVKGSGPKDRVLKEDVQSYVKSELGRPRSEGGGGLGLSLPPLQSVDFAKFGPVSHQPLSRIKKISGGFLHRNWVSIPHVTQNDEADITELEAFRKAQAEELKKSGVKLTMLGFLMKAAVAALKRFPEFNASLSPDGESLILKNYF